MIEHSLGEFEELVLLMVAAFHDKAYGVLIKRLTLAPFMWR